MPFPPVIDEQSNSPFLAAASIFSGHAQWTLHHLGGVFLSDIVREVAQIPEEEPIMTRIVIRLPRRAFPVNAVRSDQEPTDAFARYVGFAEK